MEGPVSWNARRPPARQMATDPACTQGHGRRHPGASSCLSCKCQFLIELRLTSLAAYTPDPESLEDTATDTLLQLMHCCNRRTTATDA